MPLSLLGAIFVECYLRRDDAFPAACRWHELIMRECRRGPADYRGIRYRAH